MRLGEIANITVGQILTRITPSKAEADEKELLPVRVLSPKAINGGWIVKDNTDELMTTKGVDIDKYTREGDVVIKLSGPYDSAYIDKENEGYLLPSFCAAIRVNQSQISPKYLAAYLNTSVVKQQIASATVGVRPMIKVSDLRELEVPVLSEDDMRDLGEAYQLSGLKREKLRVLIKAEEELMNRIVLSAVKEAK